MAAVAPVHERAPCGAQHELTQSLCLGHRHHAEPVGRNTDRREGPVIAAEDGDPAHLVITLVGLSPEPSNAARIRPRNGVSAPASQMATLSPMPQSSRLSTPTISSRADVADVGASPEIAELLGRREEQTHAQPRRHHLR